MSNTTTTEAGAMDFIYPKTYECPVCHREFISFNVKRSKLRVKSRDLDLRTRYHQFDPTPYDVNMCTFCGYSALTTYFDQITDRQAALVKEKITANYTLREYHFPLSAEQALERFKMAYLCAAIIEAKASVRALLCLKIAWLQRDISDKPGEMQYLRNALTGFKDAYAGETFPISGMDQQTAQYTIAELLRRVGEFNEAMRWVSNLVTAKGVSAALKERAMEIKDLIRDGVST
jgi:hypothetical protein